jgi:Xaa-Pro aminopeptidase
VVRRDAVDADAVADSRLERCLPRLRSALADRDAVAVVHAGDDANSRYLGASAVVVTADDVVHLGEPTTSPSRQPHHRDVEVRTVDDPAESVAELARELTTTTGTVLTPRTIRHDTAVFLERAGFTVTSTPVVETTRAVKTRPERDALRRLGAATTDAIGTVRDELAAGAVDGGDPSADAGGTDTDSDTGHGTESPDDAETESAGRALTTSQLTGDLRVALAGNGADAGDSTVWSVAGPEVVPGRPVVVACRPVGLGGLHLHGAATVVVDGDGGWERRASLALDHAHRAGRNRLEGALDGDTETAGSVEQEVRHELAAYGFESPTVTVHGVGCASRERPRGGDDLEAGTAVVVGTTVERTADGTASDERRSDLVTRTETLLVADEVERLVAVPASLSPERR